MLVTSRKPLLVFRCPCSYLIEDCFTPMKTEADKRSRAQASNPKSREFVDVSGQVFRTGILLNETLYLAFEPLPQGLKIERQFLARLEPDRLEASPTDDDEALGPRNALRQVGTMYTPDGREVRDWDRHIMHEKARLRLEAEQDDEIVKEAQRYVDLEDDPDMAEALAVKARQEREQTEMELKLRTKALERDEAEAVRIANALGADRVVVENGVEVLLPEEPLEQ